MYKGEPTEEKRGRDRKSHRSIEKKNKVREFISNLKATESHYGRQKSRRLYLNCTISIKKLHQIYCNHINDELYRVSFAIFRRLFVTEFNIGFKSPSSDVCTTRSLLDQRIKTFPTGSTERVNLMTQKRIHKLRANSFYSLMKEETDEQRLTCVLIYNKLIK